MQNAIFSALGRTLAFAHACAVTYAFTMALAAAQDFSKIEIKTEKLSDTLYMLIGAGGNIGVSVGADSVFVIDDQFAPMTPKIEAAIKKLTAKPVQFVLNTHWHGDHTGGNENFGKAGAIIMAHDNVRKRMSSEQFITFLRAKSPAAPAVALPTITFAQDMTLHLNGEEIYAFHVPNAHTDGDTIVHFRKANVIHMGDTFFNGFYPFIDVSSGGTADGMIATADRVLALSDDKTRIIPGHGPLSSRAELAVYRDMLATVYGRVKDLVKAGKTLDEIVAAKPAAEFDARWGKGFISAPRFLEMLVGGLKK